MRENEFIRDRVDLLYYHLQKISLKRGGSFIDSPEWLKKKKATINPKNNDDNCCQYALIIALNQKQIKSHPEYRKLNLLLISIIGKKEIFHHTQKTGKGSNKKIRELLLIYLKRFEQKTRELLLISYLYHTILKK